MSVKQWFVFKEGFVLLFIRYVFGQSMSVSYVYYCVMVFWKVVWWNIVQVEVTKEKFCFSFFFTLVEATSGTTARSGTSGS